MVVFLLEEGLSAVAVAVALFDDVVLIGDLNGWLSPEFLFLLS